MVNGLSTAVSMRALLVYAYGKWLGFARRGSRPAPSPSGDSTRSSRWAELVGETEIERVYVVGKDSIAAMLQVREPVDGS